MLVYRNNLYIFALPPKFINLFKLSRLIYVILSVCTQVRTQNLNNQSMSVARSSAIQWHTMSTASS